MNYIVLLVFLFSQVLADEASYNRGEMLFFSKACSSCHGPSAEGSSTYPKLANKDSKYLIDKMKNFKNGKAITVSQQMMSQFVEKLTDKDMQDLAYFLSNHVQTHIEDVSDDLLGGFGS